MITGVVSAYLEALVRLTVRNPGGQEQEIETVIEEGEVVPVPCPPEGDTHCSALKVDGPADNGSGVYHLEETRTGVVGRR